jgi:hypothetical protein
MAGGPCIAAEIWLRGVWRSLDTGSKQPYPLSEYVGISSLHWLLTWRRVRTESALMVIWTLFQDIYREIRATC